MKFACLAVSFGLAIGMGVCGAASLFALATAGADCLSQPITFAYSDGQLVDTDGGAFDTSWGELEARYPDTSDIPGIWQPRTVAASAGTSALATTGSGLVCKEDCSDEKAAVDAALEAYADALAALENAEAAIGD